MAKAAKKAPATKIVADSGKQRPPAAGKGRPKGAVNKVTADVRAMILTALTNAGGAEYLQKQANDNPAAFMTLVGKTLPKEITGEGGKPLFPERAVEMTEAQLLAKAASKNG